MDSVPTHAPPSPVPRYVYIPNLIGRQMLRVELDDFECDRRRNDTEEAAEFRRGSDASLASTPGTSP